MIARTPSNSRLARPRTRGFTLLETILASTVASLVLLAAMSMFLTVARTERTLAARYDQTTEMAWLQATARRALLSLVMAPNSTLDQDGNVITPDGEQPPRGRILLVPDPLAEAYLASGRWTRPLGTAQMQRLEVVLDAPPVPDALLGPAAGWASRAPADAMDFSLADIAGEDTGGVRGVFELRPDGVREQLMRSAGLAARDWPVRADDDPAGGWTLWWREYSVAEIGALTAGAAMQPDDILTPEGQERLMRAYPLVRGVDSLRWQVFDDNKRLETYAGLAQKQLPAYFELEIRTTGGKYANWMFEVGWRVGIEPTEDEASAADADTEGDDAGGGGGGGGTLRGGGGEGGGPGGGRFRSGQRDSRRAERRDNAGMGQRVPRTPPPGDPP